MITVQRLYSRSIRQYFFHFVQTKPLNRSFKTYYNASIHLLKSFQLFIITVSKKFSFTSKWCHAWQENGIGNSLNQNMHIWVIPIFLEKNASKKNILLSLYSKISDNTYTITLHKLPFMNYIHWWTQSQMH